MEVVSCATTKSALKGFPEVIFGQFFFPTSYSSDCDDALKVLSPEFEVNYKDDTLSYIQSFSMIKQRMQQ